MISFENLHVDDFTVLEFRAQERFSQIKMIKIHFIWADRPMRRRKMFLYRRMSLRVINLGNMRRTF